MTQPPEDPYDDDRRFRPYPDQGFSASNYPRYGQSPYEYPAPGYAGYAGYRLGTNENYGPSPAAAGPWRRLAAYIIDSFVVNFAVALIATPYVSARITPSMTSDDIMELAIPLGIFSTVAAYLYFTILHTTNFSTVGKRLLGIRVTTLDLQPISLGTSAIRSLWLLAGLIPLLGGILDVALSVAIFAMLFSGDQTQGLHDKWARTRGVLRCATDF